MRRKPALYSIHPSRKVLHGLPKFRNLSPTHRGAWRLRTSTNEGALAPATDDQPIVLQQAERTLDRAERDAVLRDELAMCRQLVPWAEQAFIDDRAHGFRQLDVRRPRVIRVELIHTAEPTRRAQLARPRRASLPSSSMSSIIADLAGFSGYHAYKNAPTSAPTPAGACTETLGETMQVERTRMYRVKEVAQYFQVSAATIYRAIESGQLTALRLGTDKGTYRVTGEAVMIYARICAGIKPDSAETYTQLPAGGAR